jgi:hypothetical protein
VGILFSSAKGVQGLRDQRPQDSLPGGLCFVPRGGSSAAIRESFHCELRAWLHM